MITKAKIAVDSKGLKQMYVARALGIDYTLLSKYLCGEREMPKDIIKKLAKILKVKASGLEGAVK